MNGGWSNRIDNLYVYCNEHELVYQTTVDNYLVWNQNGLLCCKDQELDDLALEAVDKRRKFRSTFAKGKYGDVASSKISSERRSWAARVKRTWKNYCLISGNVYEGKMFDSHHLYSFELHPDLRVINNNGILIHKHLHRCFHNEYDLSVGIEGLKQFIMAVYNPSMPKHARIMDFVKSRGLDPHSKE